MIGNNKMHLNEATMTDIVQQWVDNQTTLHVKVVGLRYLNPDCCFEITVTDDDRATITDCNNEMK